MVVLRASVVTVFNRTVTSGEGGESTEDTVHLTLSEMESLVDQPSPSNGSRERKISQVRVCVCVCCCVCIYSLHCASSRGPVKTN